jgi:WD40 repeat protein
LIYGIAISPESENHVWCGAKQGKLLMYDLVAMKIISQINNAHNFVDSKDEVMINFDTNAVCKTQDPNLMASGGDDGMIKLWDNRALGSYQPVGGFYGHTDGITYLDSASDKPYICSNSKD